MVLISSAFPKNITFAATLKVVNANSINVRSGASGQCKQYKCEKWCWSQL